MQGRGREAADLLQPALQLREDHRISLNLVERCERMYAADLRPSHPDHIAARLGRKIKWDPKNERILDDPQAQALVGREKRKGFEIEMG